ncbi:MAG: 50S ribosomal protein L7/L12 [Candidatus Vogelbacteria bacterium]|nr:50S ribosomal protein L7/L12 [Candidatus Vogelbacteria bacterium]
MSEKFKELLDKIESMTVLELNELVKSIEEKFGVSAQAGASTSGGVGVPTETSEEQDSFAAHLKSGGAQKIQVIKVLKEILGLGLKEAKDLVDGAPVLLKEGLKKAEAENLKKLVGAAGGEVELK